jgi:hypothetical protein
LREARHPQTEEPLFVDVHCVRERHSIDVLEHHWPDIVAIPTDGFQTRTKLDPTGELVLDDPQLTGTHRRQGVLTLPASCGRCPRQAEMRDVAPTLLELLGIPKPASMSGRSLFDTGGLNGAASCPATKWGSVVSPALTAAQQAVVETRLRDLGYLD